MCPGLSSTWRADVGCLHPENSSVEGVDTGAYALFERLTKQGCPEDQSPFAGRLTVSLRREPSFQAWKEGQGAGERTFQRPASALEGLQD